MIFYGTVLITLVLLGGWLLWYSQRWNEADWGGRRINHIDGLIRLFCRRYHRLQSDPLPLPGQGGMIVVANHISGIDALLMVSASQRPLRFIIAREEYERFGLNWFFRLAGCIPVDRQGRADLAMREALRALKRGEVVALFPHGKIHLDSDPPRRIKSGAVRLSRHSGCPIIPLRITGVRGEGKTLMALFPRSRAQIEVLPTLHCELDHDHHYTPILSRMLEGRMTAADRRTCLAAGQNKS